MTTVDAAASLVGAPVCQIAFVVTDIEASMRSWADHLGIRPWSAYTLGPPRLRDMVYRGQPARFSFRHALAWSGPCQLELVQPLTGPGIFADHLERHGEGVQHIGIVVPDHARASATLVEHGYTPLQSGAGFGLDDTGKFAYFEPPAGIGTVIELIDPPTARAEPELVYPGGRA